MMNDAKKVDGISNDAAKIGGAMPTNLTAVDRWIISKMNTLVKDVTDNMEKYELGIAADKIYNFLWEEFCDWYIEMVKPRLWDENDSTRSAALYVLKTVLVNCMKLLHPYMPFVTEEIFCSITGEESIMIQPWPVPSDSLNFAVEEKEIDVIKEAVRGVRNIRTEMNVPPSRKANVFVVSDKPAVRSIFEESSNIFEKLAFSDKVTVQADKEGIADDAVSVVIHDAVIYIPLAELVDIEKDCYHHCPVHAINYGKITRQRGQYFFKKKGMNS